MSDQTPSQEDLNEADDFFKKGNTCYNEGKYDEAIKNYDQAIGLNPKFTDAYNNRGLAYAYKGDYDEAIANYNQAIRLKPDYAEAYNYRGNAYRRKGNYDQAIENYNQALKLKPEFAEAYRNRGLAYVKKDDSDNAIANYDKAIELNPKFAEAYNNRGNAYRREGNYDQAIADYDEAILLNPKFVEAYNNRGNAYRRKGNYDQAIENYNQALKLKPDYTGVYFNRGLAYGIKDDYDQAIENFSQAIRLKPDYASAYFNRGLTYAYKGDYDQALADFSQAIELNPKFAMAYNNRGYTHYLKLNYDQAIEDYTEAIEKDKDKKSLLAYNNRGLAYFYRGKEGDYKNAKDDFIQGKHSLLSMLMSLERPSDAESEKFKAWKKIIHYFVEKDPHFKNTVTVEQKGQYIEIYIRSLELVALLHVKQRKVGELDPEPEVAHYTRKSVAESLLFTDNKENQKKEEKDRKVSPMRLGTIATANDPDEGNTLLRFLGIKNDNYSTSDVVESSNYEAFITCFTFNHESLNQFRLYGKEDNKEATGVSLVVSMDFFSTDLKSVVSRTSSDAQKQKETEKLSLFRCLYIDPQSKQIVAVGHREPYTFYREKDNKWNRRKIGQYKKYISKRLGAVSGQFQKLKKEINDLSHNLTEEQQKEADTIVAELLLNLRYLVKHVAFKEEQECRTIKVVSLQNKDEKIIVEDDARMFIEDRPITGYVRKVYFAPKTSGGKLFSDRIKKDGLNKDGNPIKCIICEHPFS